MHLRHPVVLTTVEEDFKAIGLITEDDDKKDKKAGKPVNDEEVDGDKESSVKKGGKKAESQDDATDAQLAELKQTRVKRHTSSERMKWRRAKRRGGAKAAARKYRKKSSVKRMMKRHRMKAQRLRHGKAAGRRRLHFSNDSVSNMLEDTQALLASLDESKVENSIKAFANVAIIAEMLSRSFGKFAEECEDGSKDQEHLAQAATVFGEMAEEAADIARELKESAEDIDFDDLEEVFKGQMSDLLNGLEMYADITEDEDLTNLGEDDDDDEDDDEDDEDEKDEAKEDDEEDDDADDKDGGDKKKAPPFMKKGAKAEGHKPGKKRYG